MTPFHSLTYVLAISLAVMMGISSPAFAEAQKIGVVGNVSGSVLAVNEAGETRQLNAGDTVYLNDNITSANGGKAQIMFLDKSALMINPNTQVTVDRFVFDPETASGDLSINSAKGALRFIGGALSKKKPVTIKTPVATIGIRGGIADAHIGTGGVTDAIFVYGDEMTMANGLGQTQSITTPGQGLTLMDANSMPIPLPPARVMQHLNAFSAPDGGKPAAKEAPATSDGGQGKPSSHPSDRDGEQGDKQGDKHGDVDGKKQAPKPAAGKQDSRGGDNKGQPSAPQRANATQGNPAPANGGAAAAPNDKAGMNHMMGNAEQAGKPKQIQAVKIQAVDGVGHNVSNATQGHARQDSTTTFNNRAFTPTDAGTYIARSGNGTTFSAGQAEFERNGERLNGRLIQDYPNPTSGPRFTGSLPWLQESGYQKVDQVIFADKVLAGDAYRTADGAMSFYKVNGGNVSLGTVIGRQAQSSTWGDSAVASGASGRSNVVGGLSFYDFLPELGQFKALSPAFFDYNTADSRLSGNSYAAHNLGLVVDWDKGRFLTGHLNWHQGSGVAVNRDLVLAFGETQSDGQLLSGRIYEFLTMKDTNGRNYFSGESGYVRSSTAYSAADGAAFSGLLLEGIQPDDESLSANAAFNANTAGPRVFQGVVQGDATSDAAASATGSTGHEQTGFAAGFTRTNIGNGGVGSNISYRRYGNTDASDVVITPNTADGSVTASLKLEDVAVAGQYIEGEFGEAGADSAYLTDSLYAAQQNKHVLKDATINTFTGEDVDNGVLVSASLISGVTNRCDDCAFVDWGVWAGEVDRTTGGVHILDNVAMIPYVAGQVTHNLQANVSTQNLGNVDYTGAMYGSVLKGGNLARAEGSFTAGINLDTRKLTDFNGQIADMNFGFAGQAHAISATGVAGFDNIAVQGTSSGSLSGTINGALFGPNAEDLAGNFSVQDAVSGSQAAGVYLGTRE